MSKFLISVFLIFCIQNGAISARKLDPDEEGSFNEDETPPLDLSACRHVKALECQQEERVTCELHHQRVSGQ